MTLAGELLNGVKLWITRNDRNQESDDSALRSVLTAINTTKLYLARRQRGEAADRGTEAELVKLWTAASVHLRRTDRELAKRLQMKADYWTNPDNWTDEETASNRIQIEEIALEGKRLLGNL